MTNPISENIYRETAEICRQYHPTRNRGRCCLLCRHWSGHRELRQERRHILVISDGCCRLKQLSCLPSAQELQKSPHHCNHHCAKFEKISELRAKNMTVRQRLYANMYSKTFLTKVLRWHYHDPQATYTEKQAWNKEPSTIIAKYLRFWHHERCKNKFFE